MNESSYFRRLTWALRSASVRWMLASSLLVGGLGVGACSGEEDLPKVPGGGGSAEDDPCEPGASRACGVTLDQDHGIVSCYRGTQICDDDGIWGECQGGSITEEPDPTARDANGRLRFKSLSLSLPISCYSNDVCKSTVSWSATATYSAGDRIKHDVGSLHGSTGLGGAGSDVGEDYYECISAANCNGAAAAYEPGVGSDWEDAWTRVGSCLDLCDPGCNYFFENPPGGGSMPPPEFPGTPDSELCEHNLCTPGVALDPAMPCDACVTSVCSVRPTCCTATWDATCVDLTYTECSHSPPPQGLCDFGLFAETTITTGNRPVSGSAIGANGNVTIGTDLAGTLPIVTVKGDLQINAPNGKAISIPGGVWVTGNINFQSGGGAVWTGDFTAGGSIDTSGGNRINGEAWAIGSINGQSGAGINQGAYAGGTISNNINSPTPFPKVTSSTHEAPVVNIPTAIPTRTVSCPGTTNIWLGGGQTYPTTYPGGVRTIPPGNYGSVNMSNGNNYLRLGAPGAYTFTSINAGGGNSGTRNVILLSEPTGNYDITVCGAVDVGNWFDTRTCTTSNCDNGTSVQLTTATRFLLYGHTSVSAGTDSYFGGVTWVPNGAFTSGDRTRVNGPLWASQVAAGTDLNATQLSEADCTALGIPGTAPVPGVCPIDNIDPGSPPQTVEPCETGADCQVNQRCTETVTDACAHSKCAPGAALADGCDRCVSMICDIDPSCCNAATGRWSWACVDKVATVCDAYCGEFATDICQHGICDPGIAIDAGCNSCTTNVCSNAAYAYCCDSSTGPGWNQACVDRAYTVCGSGVPVIPARGTTVCDYAVLGGYNILASSARIWGGDVGGGTGANTIQGAWAGRSQVCLVAATDAACTSPANIYSHGTVFLSDAVETGQVYARGSYARSGGTTPSREPPATGDPGTVTIPSASVAARTFSCGTGSTAVNSSATWSQGTYGDVTVNGWGSTVLTLNPGTYYFNSLTLGGNTRLNVPTGNVIINICGNFKMEQSSQIIGLGTGIELFRLQIYARGTLTMDQNAYVRGILMGATSGSAGSQVTYGAGVVHEGAVWTNGGVSIGVSNPRVTIDRTSFTREECLTAQLDPTNMPVSCPAITPPVPDPLEVGSCVSNEGLAAEAACTTYDLAADYPCDNAIPICNHGSGAFSGNVTVGYWDTDENQFAVSNPSTAGMLTCVGALSIPAGACADLPCPMAAGTDYTIMVDPNDALAECNNHRSDNWSWKQAGTTCGSGGAVVDAEYDYLADCPEGTSARWKYLTWVTDVPSGLIDWAAKVGDSDAELDSASYTTIGTATAATEVCAVTGATPGPSTACPVAITDELSLSANQGQMLRLQITPSGGAMVQDWAVSYTCAYDE